MTTIRATLEPFATKSKKTKRSSHDDEEAELKRARAAVAAAEQDSKELIEDAVFKAEMIRCELLSLENSKAIKQASVDLERLIKRLDLKHDWRRHNKSASYHLAQVDYQIRKRHESMIDTFHETLSDEDTLFGRKVTALIHKLSPTMGSGNYRYTSECMKAAISIAAFDIYYTGEIGGILERMLTYVRSLSPDDDDNAPAEDEAKWQSMVAVLVNTFDHQLKKKVEDIQDDDDEEDSFGSPLSTISAPRNIVTSAAMTETSNSAGAR